VREGSVERGNGVGCSGGGVELAFYRGRGSTREATTGGNDRSNGLNAIDDWGG
jgi:hypothetical protein